jgi:hypothetical protein
VRRLGSPQLGHFDAAGSGSLVLVTVLLYVTCFAVSLGPGSWLYISELFPTEVRGRAMSPATLSLWAACTLVTMTSPTLSRLVVSGAFLLYAGMCAVAFLSGGYSRRPKIGNWKRLRRSCRPASEASRSRPLV